MKEALYYEKLDDKRVKCTLCPNFCNILLGKRGSCKVRENQDGKLVSLVYGKLVAGSIDPIEKKPLFHFLPASKTYSISTVGCNFHCLFCQNWDISQAEPENIPFRQTSPEQVVKEAKEKGCSVIAYTYVEPTIFYEFVLDCAKLAHQEGLKNILVTNGYINSEPLKELAPFIEAVNIDLKSFSDDFYKKLFKGKLQPVLDSAKLMKDLGIHLELTTLIIPGYNDNMKEIEKMCSWIQDNLGKETPLHLSRFYPMYKLSDVKPTPVETLLKAAKVAEEHLDYVYVGNIPENEHNNTICPACKKTVIKRTPYYDIEDINIKEGKCPFCQHKINGIFSKKS